MKEAPFLQFDIDLYALHLLAMVAKYRSFTAAAKACGLSQSALTRQVQSIESRLGIKVFERTTRQVSITEPGAVLLRETEAIPGILSAAMRRIREDYLGDQREIRIGISHDLALAHIAGIFHVQSKHQPDVRILVSQWDGIGLMTRVGNSKLDLGILTAPPQLPDNVRVTHRMADHFSILVAASTDVEQALGSVAGFRKWALSQGWLLPPGPSPARQLIDHWARDMRAELRPVMELDNFDLMIQFVSMGMGVALVPRRCLGGFPRKQLIKWIQPPTELQRELTVISPKHGKTPDHVTRFVEGILFS